MVRVASLADRKKSHRIVSWYSPCCELGTREATAASPLDLDWAYKYVSCVKIVVHRRFAELAEL
jgi:hypothetical protein